MIKIGENYYFREARLAQVVGEGRPLAEAYPNLPSDILEQLQEEATRRFGTKTTKKKHDILAKLQEVVTARFCTKPTKKKQTKKKLNHD